MVNDDNPSALSSVTASARRCLAAPAFHGVFFDDLARRAPGAVALFAGADERILRNFLRNAITLLLMDAAGSPNAADRLDYVRTHHGPDALNVRPEWFAHWVESLMHSVRGVDPEYSAALEASWRRVIAAGVQKVIP